jgi:hypothetical protein
VGDGLAINPGVEDAPAGCQPPDAGVVAFGVPPADQLLDDGADLRGRQEGRTYSFPVGYAEDPEGLMTFTWFSWWTYFREERPVSLRLRIRELRGTAVAVRDPEPVAERFAYYLRRNPHDARYFGVRVGRDGRANPPELIRAAGRLVMIRTVLDGEPHAS